MSPEVRISVFYLTLYMSGGAATTFAGPWFEGKGFSSEQIALLNAVPILALLVLNLVVGRLADRAGDWRQAIVVGAVVSGIVPVGLFFTEDFWGILLFWSLAGISQAVVAPVLDAAAMRVSLRRGTDYGTIRAWGTVGFMLAILATGYLVSWYGPVIFVPLFVGLSLLRAAASLALPNFRAPVGDRRPAQGATRLLHVMRPWFLLPLIGWSMVFSTLLVLNAFQGLLWARQGLSPDVIGLLIGLGAASEAVAFFAFRHLPAGIAARTLMLVSAVVGVLRWLAMAQSPGVPVLVVLQLTHGIVFTLGFLGCMQFIANWTAEEIAAEAQGFFVMLQQAMSVVTILAFGWLTTHWGAQAYFGSALMAGAGGLLVWLSLRLRQPKV